MRNFGLFILGVWLISQGVVEVVKIEFSYARIILAGLSLCSGILLLLSVIKTIPKELGIFLLASWLITGSSMILFEISFSNSSTILSIIGGIAGLLLIFRK